MDYAPLLSSLTDDQKRFLARPTLAAGQAGMPGPDPQQQAAGDFRLDQPVKGPTGYTQVGYSTTGPQAPPAQGVQKQMDDYLTRTLAPWQRSMDAYKGPAMQEFGQLFGMQQQVNQQQLQQQVGLGQLGLGQQAQNLNAQKTAHDMSNNPTINQLIVGLTSQGKDPGEVQNALQQLVPLLPQMQTGQPGFVAGQPGASGFAAGNMGPMTGTLGGLPPALAQQTPGVPGAQPPRPGTVQAQEGGVVPGGAGPYPLYQGLNPGPNYGALFGQNTMNAVNKLAPGSDVGALLTTMHNQMGDQKFAEQLGPLLDFARGRHGQQAVDKFINPSSMTQFFQAAGNAMPGARPSDQEMLASKIRNHQGIQPHFSADQARQRWRQLGGSLGGLFSGSNLPAPPPGPGFPMAGG